MWLLSYITAVICKQRICTQLHILFNKQCCTKQNVQANQAKELIEYMFVSWAKAPAKVYYFMNQKVLYRKKIGWKWEATVAFSSNPRTRPVCQMPEAVFFLLIWISFTLTRMYSRTSLFRTRLIRSPRYFEGRSNALGFTLPLYASPVISKPRYFELFSISLGTSK